MAHTWTALTTLTQKAPAEALGEALEALDPAPLGVGVFEVEDGSDMWEVGGYFTEPPDTVALAVLSAAFGAAEFAVSEVPETDWVAHVRRELPPVEAGRFFVYGSHDAALVPQGRTALLIEASMAFGTGHHGTTKGCLDALEAVVQAGAAPKRIVDVGCGTAVLAMAAAAVWPEADVLATDIDPVAVDVAKANLDANGYGNRVTCFEAAGFDDPRLADGAFDLIFANILMGPLLDLASPMAAAASDGATAILSGILTHQAEAVTARYVENGFNLVERSDIVEWSTLCLRYNDQL